MEVSSQVHLSFPSYYTTRSASRQASGRAMRLPHRSQQAYTDEAALGISRRTERGGIVRDTPTGTGKQTDSARQLIERAQHVLAYEQRSGHQDTVVKPGGIAAFIERWATQMRAARDRGEIAAPPAGASGRFPEVAILHLLTDYRALDPMQRAAKIRAALALLDAFDTPESPDAPTPRPAPRPSHPHGHPPPRRALASPPMVARPHARRSPRPRSRGRWPSRCPSRPFCPPSARDPPTPPREPRPEDEYLLQAAVTAVPGVGATQETRLARLGIETVRDLLFTFPREHHDYSTLQKIGQLPFDQVSTDAWADLGGRE